MSLRTWQVYACMHACMYVCMHVCMHACMHACMHVCMYLCMYVCMYVCMSEAAVSLRTWRWGEGTDLAVVARGVSREQTSSMREICTPGWCTRVPLHACLFDCMHSIYACSPRLVERAKVVYEGDLRDRVVRRQLRVEPLAVRRFPAIRRLWHLARGRGLGIRGLGIQGLGSRGLGSRGLGSRGLGSRGLGSRGLGSRGIRGDGVRG